MTQEIFDELCKAARYSQPEIDKINKARLNYAGPFGISFQPYVPMQTELGPIVRPE